MSFGLLVGMLGIGAIGSIELASLYNVHSKLQHAADSAALAAAREISVMGMSTGTEQTIKSVVQDMFFANGGKSISTDNTVVTADFAEEQGVLTVNVTLDANVPPLLRYALNVGQVNVTSQVRIAGSPNVCVIALDGNQSRALDSRSTSVLSGRNCGVYVNSGSPTAIAVRDDSRVNALFTCSHGGAEGLLANFSPAPITDCPKIADPLLDRPEPRNASDPCEYNQKKVSKVESVIRPGVYCGGIKINARGVVAMTPGTYIIRDGAFEVDGQTALSGKGVTIFLKGTGAVVNFAGNAKIDLEAPTDGEMAGILIFDSRSQNSGNIHKITSNKARRIVGAIYLPNTQLEVDAPAPVGEDSPWTAIIAREIRLIDDSQLVLNTNFDSTDVPAPPGVRGSGEPMSLIK